MIRKGYDCLQSHFNNISNFLSLSYGHFNSSYKICVLVVYMYVVKHTKNKQQQQQKNKQQQQHNPEN